MAYLAYTDAHGRKQVLTLAQQPIVIGRDPACDITYPDKRISRKHTRIFFDRGKWHVQDLESTNGTQLNNQSTSMGALVEKDHIQIGPLELEFLIESDSEPSIIFDKNELTRAVSKGQLSALQYEGELHQRWEMLLEIADALDVLGTTQELLAQFMASILQLFRPDTCILALGDEYLRRPETSPGSNDPMETSIAKVMGRVRERKQGVVFEPNQDSLVTQVCVPVLVSGSMRGVMYLDRRDKDAVSFTRDDLRTLVILARLISAAAISSDKLARLDAENRMLSAQFGKAGNVIGQSRETKKLVEIIERKIGPVDTTVLFTGETGTGKTWAAQALHLASGRAKGPFVKVNCAAIPDNLIESELFGYEKGAFSGAVARKTGLFEAAAGGTLLLDEIGELNPSSQAKLLTVLQDKKLSRVGSTKAVDIDIRIVAATNIDLKQAVETGQFRSDLYYRLNIITLQIPPLRNRKEDILPLADHFLERFNSETGKHISGIDEDVRRTLQTYPWPGNVRELSNAIERAVIFAEPNDPLTLADFPEDIANYQPSLPQTGQSDDERDLVAAALSQASGNKREAARILGWYPQKLYARLKEFNLS